MVLGATVIRAPAIMADMTGAMAGKTVLITGGTGGIGRATAAGLAAMGARVAITGRDRGRAEAAAIELGDAAGNQSIDAVVADLSSQGRCVAWLPRCSMGTLASTSSSTTSAASGPPGT